MNARSEKPENFSTDSAVALLDAERKTNPNLVKDLVQKRKKEFDKEWEIDPDSPTNHDRD